MTQYVKNGSGSLRKNLEGSLQEVMLGHLSKENNFPELAYQTVIEELISKNFDENSIRVSVANRNEPSKLVTVS